MEAPADVVSARHYMTVQASVEHGKGSMAATVGCTHLLRVLDIVLIDAASTVTATAAGSAELAPDSMHLDSHTSSTSARTFHHSIYGQFIITECSPLARSFAVPAVLGHPSQPDDTAALHYATLVPSLGGCRLHVRGSAAAGSGGSAMMLPISLPAALGVFRQILLALCALHEHEPALIHTRVVLEHVHVFESTSGRLGVKLADGGGVIAFDSLPRITAVARATSTLAERNVTDGETCMSPELLRWQQGSSMMAGGELAQADVADFALADHDAALADEPAARAAHDADVAAAPFNTKVDIFAAGCVLYTLLTGTAPRGQLGAGFPNRFADVATAAAAASSAAYPYALLDAHFPRGSVQRNLLALCTNADPVYRPTAAALLTLPALRNL